MAASLPLSLCLAGAACGLALSASAGEAAVPAVPVDPQVERIDTVLTPTRLKQPISDVPASVSVITADTLARWGIFSIADALRLVPGMAVVQPTGGDFRISYHGTNVLTPRRMNVLVDGVSVYQPAFARVDWKSLPIVIEDIDRIEVTRGPNSAAYGPNSMLAIVNIITKHPKDVERGFVALTAGSDRSARLVARLGARIGEHTRLSLTGSAESDEGYDLQDRIEADNDDTRVARINFRSETILRDDTQLRLDAGYAAVEMQVPFADVSQASYPDRQVSDGFFAATIKHQFSAQHELLARASYWFNRVEQEWTTCPAAALLLPEMFALWRSNPDYVNAILAGRLPSGGTPQDDALALAALSAIAALGPNATQPVCTRPNQNLAEKRIDLEIQDTFVASERLRVVGGVGLRQQEGDSETYLAGSASTSSWRGFGSAEFKPTPSLTANVGMYAERDSLSGWSTSYRVGSNFHLSDRNTLRVAWSSGSRTPDIQEQRADWTYTSYSAVPPLNGQTTVRFFQSAQSPGGLQHERIQSLELGYLLTVPESGFALEAKAFDDRLTHLISEKLQVAEFEPTNGNRVRLSGFELQATVDLANWTGFGSYAYLRNHEATTPLERTLYSRHSGAVGISHRMPDDWRWSLAYFGASGDGIDQASYGRWDLTLSKRWVVGTDRVTASVIGRRLDSPSTSNFRDFGSPTTASYERKTQVYVQLKVSF